MSLMAVPTAPEELHGLARAFDGFTAATARLEREYATLRARLARLTAELEEKNRLLAPAARRLLRARRGDAALHGRPHRRARDRGRAPVRGAGGARGRRPASPAPRAAEPDAERGAGDAHGRDADRRGRAGPGRHAGDRRRHGAGHLPWRGGRHLPAVLHHAGERHGARSGGRPGAGGRDGRHAGARERARPRRSLHGGPARRGGEEGSMRSVLIVDDEPGMRAGLSEVLGRGGFTVEQAASAEEALARLGDRQGGQGAMDLLVTDLRLPGMSGLELIRAARQAGSQMPAIVITAHGTVEDAVAAMKLGAFDFLTKPFSPADLLHLAGRAAGERPAPEAGSGRAKGGEGAAPRRRPIITRDPAMQRVLTVAESVASSRAPVLVQGESGTGKELLARYVHESGCRRGKPFVAVNCAALPRDLLERELFGHERGAFTGAITRKTAQFDLASGGTILLDEISEMEVGLQAEVPRVLQEYEVDRVGGNVPVPVDVRVVATTNRRLAELVDRGRFREDLYYRLTVIPLVLPPLRERPGDIDLLADDFLERFSGGRALRLAPEAREALKARSWPGNVRELENTLERAALLARSEVVTREDLDDRDAGVPRLALGDLAGLTVREMERRLIFDTLKRTQNNRTQAARLLGISIRTLRNKLAEYRHRGELPAETSPET